MRALCRALDWSQTPLGPLGRWPLSLRTTVATLLASRFPMLLFWGPQLIQLYNDAYRDVMGASEGHPGALGAPAAEFWSKRWDLMGPQIAQVMSGGEGTWHEDSLIPVTRNGVREDRWWTYGYSPAFDDEGGVAGALVVCWESTRRVRSEKRLESLNKVLEVERSRLEYVFQRAPAFLSIVRGSPLAFEFVNEAYYQLVGYRDLVGREVFEAIPEARGQGFEELLERVARTGEPFVGKEIPLMISRTPGAPPEERIIDFVYFPLAEPDGTRTGVITHGVDVTEHIRARREVERLLLESEQLRIEAEFARSQADAARAAAELGETQLRNLADAIPTLAWTAGADGSIDWYNARWYEYTNTVSEQMRGWGWQSVHDPEVLPIVLERWRASVATGQPFEMTFPLRGGDGKFRTFLTRVVPVHDNDGRVTRWFGTNTDIDAEVRLRREAQDANRAKSEFLAVMSHELRTPLNAIDGYAELMEMGIRGPLTKEQQHDLVRIRKSQRHLLGLINGVLNYARVEAGALHYEITDVRLDSVLATCEALVAPQVHAKRLTLTYENLQRAVLVRADEEKLQQIVINLLGNAIKFTEPDGRIVLGCKASAEEIRISVADTGCGISAEQVQRVFEPFVQVDSQLTRTKEGVGLGLAISRDLARGMGGDLTLESTLGVGSTFTLTLPRAD